VGVKVNIPQNLQHLARGVGVVEVPGKNVGQCLEKVVEQFPALEKALFDKEHKLLNYVDIAINGRAPTPMSWPSQ